MKAIIIIVVILGVIGYALKVIFSAGGKYISKKINDKIDKD